MRTLLGLTLALVLSTTAARAADVTITLNDSEQKAFMALLDLAVKQGGLAAAKAAAVLSEKVAMQVAKPSTLKEDAAKPDVKKPEPSKK